MSEIVYKLIIYGIVIILTAVLTKALTDKKGWQISLLILLLALATFSEKAIQLISEDHRPRLVVWNMPVNVEHKNNSLKIGTDILLRNTGDRPAEKVVPETTLFQGDNMIGTYTNEHEITIEVDEIINFPSVINVGTDVLEGRAKLSLVFVVPYYKAKEAMPPLKKKWVFEPHKDMALKPTWEVVPFEQ